MSTHVEAIETAVLPAVRGQSPAAAAWRRLLASPVARMGLVIVTVFVVGAALAPVVHDYDPKTDSSLTDRLKPPSGEHPFGTDSLGRDILIRVVHGARVSLGLGVSSVIVAATLGSLLGLVAGYVGRWTDLVVMFCMDILLAFPGTLLAIAIVAMIGPGLRNSLLAISTVAITQRPFTQRIQASSAMR